MHFMIMNTDENNIKIKLEKLEKELSALKQENEKLKADITQESYLLNVLMDNIPDSIYFKNTKSQFIRITTAMAWKFGLSSPQEAIGKTDFDFFSRHHAEQAYNDEQKIINTGSSLIDIEEMETWPDGAATWVSTTKMCIKNQQDDIIGTFGISRDITDKKTAQEKLKISTRQLKQAMRNLKRSNAELEQFAYIASHDLQEPLRMITGYLQLLSKRYKEKLDSNADEFIDFAVDGANRMKDLINDLLVYSRVDTKGKTFVTTDCNAVLNIVLAHLKMAIEENKAHVEICSLPVIRADSNQMIQLFQNLISNAIKFKGKKAPVIKIGVEQREREWCFFVQDNGIGIDPAFKDRIFLIFQRLHTREEYQGTGIGLSVCKKIVERHKGKIWVESAPGKGAAFFFTIPDKDLKNCHKKELKS